MRRRPRWIAMAWALGVATLAQDAVVFDWTAVVNARNADETTGHGGVGYDHHISIYEVRNDQYAEFLNAVAASDPYGLYNANRGFNALGGITQSGSSGSYTCATKPNMADKPVNHVSFPDAMRFICSRLPISATIPSKAKSWSKITGREIS